MQRVYVNEKWCIGCHLCEYNCAFANSGSNNMVTALKDVVIHPRIQVEENGAVCFAVSCRHCEDPWCVKGCISGALHIVDGVVQNDSNKCVGCYTCILSCPYGCIVPSGQDTVLKCELCIQNSCGEPACVKGCPNQAIVFEER